MKKSKKFCCRMFLISMALIFCRAQAAPTPLGTGFTYQGMLYVMGNPATGNYDFQFALFDSPTNGNQIGPTLTNLNVPVKQGLFSTTVDFGSGNFVGNSLWLALSVRTNGSAASFDLMSPLQQMTATPNALFARNNAQTTNALASIALLNTTVTAATNALGTMAYQPTNSPTFSTGLNYGQFNVLESGATSNDAMIQIGQGNMWYNYGHSVEPEWQFSDYGSVSWTIGEDGQGKAICHFGGSGAYHSLWYMQYDDLRLTNVPGHSTPFGYALHLNQGANQNFIFGYWMATQDPGLGQSYRLNWHDFGGQPAPGFNQNNEYMSTDHIAGGLGSNTIFWGGGEFTNEITRGNVTIVPASVQALDFSYTGTDFPTYNAASALTLVITNLVLSNLSVVKDIAIHNTAPTALRLSLPTNWIVLNSIPVNANPLPTNLPAGNDLLIHLIANCGQHTNIYATFSYGFNPP
jgi:hypothetical protein